jgi:hypothetical protein
MSIRDTLMQLTEKVHKIEAGGVELYFKHLKSSHTTIIMKQKKGTNTDAIIFALCACDENGDPLFTIEELDQIEELPTKLVADVVKAAMSGDAKKPLGR